MFFSCFPSSQCLSQSPCLCLSLSLSVSLSHTHTHTHTHTHPMLIKLIETVSPSWFLTLPLLLGRLCDVRTGRTKGMRGAGQKRSLNESSLCPRSRIGSLQNSEGCEESLKACTVTSHKVTCIAEDTPRWKQRASGTPPL